eukprot:Skav221084  [mRNA]  locus=scaffold6458:35728:37365:- [translate_table: standard]
MAGRPAGAQPKSRPVRKPSKKDGHATKTAQAARKAPKQKSGHVKREPTKRKGFQSKQNKLLTKIRDLLKKLPRAERNDVIANQFSQKQRLILEKWMADAQRESQAQEGEGPASQEMAGQIETEHPNRLHATSCALALPTVPRITSSGKMIMQASAATCQAKKTKRRKHKKKESEAKPRGKGWIRKYSSSYTYSYEAGISFDAIDLRTGSFDLQTALDYLILLTAVKQKMQGSESTQANSFKERLQVALESSAFEHGKNLADLRLSFSVGINAGFLIGDSMSSYRTPRVHSLEKFARVRKIFEPFRQRSQINTGGRSIYWFDTPDGLQHMWGLYQQAVADAWEVIGSDSTVLLQKMRATYEARSEFRNTQLQRWERGHMAMEDKNRHRPRHLRVRYSLTPLERWERQQMALEDRRNNRHGPGSKKSKLHLKLHRPSKKLSKPSPLLVLKKLLGRWGRMLKMEERLLDKERRRVVRQRKAQRKAQREARLKKEREERKQAQALIREQRLRRETLRKRMRSDLTMDDLLGGIDGQRTEKNELLYVVFC